MCLRMLGAYPDIRKKRGISQRTYKVVNSDRAHLGEVLVTNAKCEEQKCLFGGNKGCLDRGDGPMCNKPSGFTPEIPLIRLKPPKFPSQESMT